METRRRDRAPRDAAQRQADLRVAPHRDPRRRRVLRLLRWLGRQGDGGDRSPSRATISPTRCASRSASCAAIVPWNFPLLIAAWKVAPALACGNTVILKPASQTPLTALALGEIALRSRAAAGRAQRHHRPRARRVGQAMVEHPGIDKIAFTGDTSTGKAIMKSAADTLKKITLELGGKSPNIVLADADIDAAIRGATIGIFYGKGEVCAAGSRLLVDKSIKNEFIDKLAARVKKMVAGDPMDPKTRFGAIVIEEADGDRAALHRHPARAKGARSWPAASVTDIGTGKGYFVQPTVFADVNAGDDHRARGDLRAGAGGDRVRGPRRSDRAAPTTRRTASPPASGRATSRRRTTSRESCRPARSGSTPTTSTTPRCRSAATSRAASAAK